MAHIPERVSLAFILTLALLLAAMSFGVAASAHPAADAAHLCQQGGYLHLVGVNPDGSTVTFTTVGDCVRFATQGGALATPTQVPTVTPTVTSTVTSTVTATATATSTPTPTPPIPTPTATSTPTPTPPIPTPTATSTPTPTPPIPTPTPTATPTP